MIVTRLHARCYKGNVLGTVCRAMLAHARPRKQEPEVFRRIWRYHLHL